MPWYVFFYDHNGTENVRGPYNNPGTAQEKLDSAEGDGVIERYGTSDVSEAIRLHKEKKIDEVGVERGVKNIRHRPLRSMRLHSVED